VILTRATTIDDLRMAAAHDEVLDAYRENYRDAVKAGDRDEADRWARSLRDFRRLDRRLVTAPWYWSPLRRNRPERRQDDHALRLDPDPEPPAADLYEAEAGHDPPRPLDAATTSPHRPCAPPTSLPRGQEWLPHAGTVGTTQKEGESSA
jgi:hypothetical protein